MPYAAVGLLYCGIDTTQPGTYTVTFTVVHGNNATVSVQRTVVVQPLCSPGEVACSDGACGEWGVLLAGGKKVGSRLSVAASSGGVIYIGAQPCLRHIGAQSGCFPA